MGEVGQTSGGVVGVSGFGDKIGRGEVFVSLDRRELAGGVVGEIDAFVGDGIATDDIGLFDFCRAIQVVVGVGVFEVVGRADFACQCGTVPHSIVGAGEDDIGNARGSGIVFGEDAAQGIVGVGQRGIGIGR